MTILTRSIRVRLIVFALIGTLVAITFAAFGLTALFDRHVERRIGQELDTYIAQLAGQLRVDGSTDALTLRSEPSDPRFSRPLSGLYWQVRDERSGSLLRSRSLWDTELPLTRENVAPGATQISNITTADGNAALQHEKSAVLVHNDAERPVRIAVAVDRAELAELRSGFARDLVPGLALLSTLILVATWLHISAGLRPLSAIQSGLEAVRSGRSERLQADVPQEISPLVTEVNNLLAAQEADLERARSRAADLAHGLRTPLTALASDIARLREKGEAELADDIEALATQMRRTIERELARARLRHQRTAIKPVPLGPTVGAIMRTLERTPAGERVSFENAVDDTITVAVHAEDLAEILGNLLENATRFARSHIRVTALQEAVRTVITIDDDGKGTDPREMEALMGRGQRKDETGSAGLGLAIVGDIFAAYGGEIRFARSDLGGLSVQCTVPAP